MKKWFSIIVVLLVLLFISSAPIVTETDVGKPDGIAIFENFESADVLSVEIAVVKAYARQNSPNVDESMYWNTYCTSTDVPLYAITQLYKDRPSETVHLVNNKRAKTTAETYMPEIVRTHTNVGKYISLSKENIAITVSDNLNKKNFVAGRILRTYNGEYLG